MEKFVRLSEKKPKNRQLCEVKTNLGECHQHMIYNDEKNLFHDRYGWVIDSHSKSNGGIPISWRGYKHPISPHDDMIVDISFVSFIGKNDSNGTTLIDKPNLTIEAKIIEFLRKKEMLADNCENFVIIIGDKRIILNDTIKEFVESLYK